MNTESNLKWHVRRLQEERARADNAEAQLREVRETLKRLIDFAHGADMPIVREG